MAVDESGIAGTSKFPSTSWSMIRHARDPASPEYARHLRRLIELYWRPVYSVIRHAWRVQPADAQDLTQEFFATVVLGKRLLGAYVPDRGSFRALLKAAVVNFLRQTTRDAGRKVRGGDMVFVAFDDEGLALAERIADGAARSPEQVFDDAWNEVVVTRALAIVEERLIAQGKGNAFQVFRRYDLDPDGMTVSYADVAKALGLTVPQVKHALREARATLRQVVTHLAREYVDGPEALASELRNLLGR